jgi:recombination protein RecT
MSTTPAEGKKALPPAKTAGGAPPAAPPVAGAGKAPTLAMQAKGIVDIVEARIGEFLRTGQLVLPKDYSPDNALKSAWLVLQTTEDKDGKKALEVCTRDSIANSLLDMIVQGLNPAKKQGYFIVYGKTLTFQRSYFGSMAVAKMVNPKIDDFSYAVVYEDDTFKYGIKNGKKTVEEHIQDIKNVKKDKIVAAYSIALNKDGEPMKTEIATFDEIKQSWKMSKTHPVMDGDKIKPDSTHGKFTADMALKTVINKNCKIIINASSDNALLLERINRNEDLADAAMVRVEIDERANAGDALAITEDAGRPEEIGAETGQTGQGPEDLAAETAQAVCVCDQMIKEKLKEWDCPLHGRYQGGRFTPPPQVQGQPDKRKPEY